MTKTKNTRLGTSIREEWRLARGSKILILMAGLQVATATVLIVITVLVSVHLNDERKARRDAARDSCNLLVGLVHAATTKAPRQRAAAKAYINRTPLRNCTIYAKDLIK